MDGAQERGVAAAATPRAYPAASPALPPRPILSPRTGPHNGAAAASATSRSRRAAYVAPFEPPSVGGGVRLPGAAQAPAFPPPPDFPPLPPRPPSSPPPLVTAVLRSAAARVGTHQHVPQCRMVGGGGAPSSAPTGNRPGSPPAALPRTRLALRRRPHAPDGQDVASRGTNGEGAVWAVAIACPRAPARVFRNRLRQCCSARCKVRSLAVRVRCPHW